MPISEEPTIAPVTEEDEGPIIMDLSQDVANVEVNDFVEVIPDYLLEIPNKFNISIDIMIEAKNKEEAVLYLYDKYKDL